MPGGMSAPQQGDQAWGQEPGDTGPFLPAQGRGNGGAAAKWISRQLGPSTVAHPPGRMPLPTAWARPEGP